MSARPDPFLAVPIVVDTRERRPYDFGRHPASSAALESGDYSLEGFEGRLAIERKASSDLLHCIAGERERFENELERLAALDFAAVVVEASFSDLLRPSFGDAFEEDRRRLQPASVVGSLTAWGVRFGLGFWFAGNWLQGREVTYRLLKHWWRYRVAGEAGPRGFWMRSKFIPHVRHDCPEGSNRFIDVGATCPDCREVVK